MKRPICACALLSIMLLSACQGTIKGKDTLEPCNGYANGTITVFPEITTDTQVSKCLAELISFALIGDYKSAFDMLAIQDDTFVNLDAFKSWFLASGIQSEYSISENNRDKTKVMTLTSGTVSYDFYPEYTEAGIKYRLDALCVNDFKITIPTGIPATLDSVDLASYAVGTEGNNTIYNIPQIADTAHILTVDTVFTDPINLTIDNCSKSVDVNNYLGASKALRKQMINDIASPTLVTVQKLIAKQDWSAFCKHFTPEKNMKEYQAHFYKGAVKADAYNFKLVETRDLELSDLDVHYTGYDTISVKFGTKWTWSHIDDVKFDKEGNFVSVNENRIKTMRIVNTLEFYYNAEKDKWYLHSIDTESITLLSPGEEQWR